MVIIKTDGPSGNAHVILGIVEEILKLLHNEEKQEEVIKRYLEEARSKDYEHLKQVSLNYVNPEYIRDNPILVFTTEDNVETIEVYGFDDDGNEIIENVEKVIDMEKAQWKFKSIEKEQP